MGIKDLLGGGGDDADEAKDSQESFGEPLVDPSVGVAGGGTTSNIGAAGPDVDPDDGLASGEGTRGRPSDRDHDL